MKINANSIKVGSILQHEGKLWAVLKTQHVKPGKGGAFAVVEMKEIIEGTKLNTRFRSSEDVELVRLDEEEYQYLFAEGDMLTFMHKGTYEQISLPEELLGEKKIYLQDGMEVTITSYEGRPISVTLPDHITLKIIETESVVKGQTAASSYKPATLENGARVMVPPFIGVGERIVVNIEEEEYVERAKD